VGNGLQIFREVIRDFWVYRLRFPVMAVSKYVWIRFAIYLRNLALSKIILTMAKFGMENAFIGYG